MREFILFILAIIVFLGPIVFVLFGIFYDPEDKSYMDKFMH